MLGDPTAPDRSLSHLGTRQAGGLLDALKRPGRLRTVELRPPRVDLSEEGSVDVWIDLNRAVGSLLREGRFILFTDDAVGSREEESLQHLSSNLGQNADLSQVVPFLTCKHSLDYCLLFAQRAASLGVAAITVTGGDATVGPPRCVPRSRDLRKLIHERLPDLLLGGWVNPFRDPVEQVDLLLDPAHHADYYLTQVVSHHRVEPIDGFLEESARRGLRIPGFAGVFFYRSALAKTLARLRDFIPVPEDELIAEFDAGASAETVCARTLTALAERGIEKVYISNLNPRTAGQQLEAIERAV